MQRFSFNCNLSFNVFDYPIEIVLTDTNELKAIRSLRFIIWLRVIPCRCSIYKVHFITRDKTRLNYAVVSWQNNKKPDCYKWMTFCISAVTTYIYRTNYWNKRHNW